MRTPIGIVTTVMVLSGFVSAQDRQPDPPPAVKQQTAKFEALLKDAVLAAARRLTEAVTKLQPNVVVEPDSDPEAVGYWVAGEGYRFRVQPGGLLPSAVFVFRMAQQSNPTPTLVKPAASVVTAPVATADPVTVSPILGSVEPEKLYGELVREELINVLLDNSGGLPIQESETIEIVARAKVDPGANPLYAGPKQLVLIIKGVDLIAYHANALTKDQIKAKIKESRY